MNQLSQEQLEMIEKQAGKYAGENYRTYDTGDNDGAAIKEAYIAGADWQASLPVDGWIGAQKMYDDLMKRYNDNRYSSQRQSCYYDLAKDLAAQYPTITQTPKTKTP